MKPRRILEHEPCRYCKGQFPELCLVCHGTAITDKHITIYPDGSREMERQQ
ncbi:MAG: hypothetical protein RQ754_03005 [Desulfuromonadales bacterium]|nr:hypothetical protein [Desulfuromonadales bacterium]